MSYALMLVSGLLSPKTMLEPKLLAAESQLAVLKHGIEEVRIAYHCPWQNPFVESFFGTLRRELLNHIIPINDQHLYRLIDEYLEEYYHSIRLHQGLGGDTPVPHQPQAPPKTATKLVSIPILGGLHHNYHRVAA